MNNAPRVVLCSIWRNDAHRDLAARAAHLLSKADAWPNLRWVWAVGDSTDQTAAWLRTLSAGYDVTVIVADSGLTEDDPATRLRRLSITANALWREVSAADDYVLVHESDLITPRDIISRLIEHAESGYCPIAGWPTLEIRPGHKVFYDTFCYRKDGVRFTNNPPYHKCYQPNELFAVDSAGTMLMFHAEDAPHLHMTDEAILDVCRQLRGLGRIIHVDPTLEVIQPHSLWIPRVA